MITEEKLQRIEEQIIEEKKAVDFDTREFTVEFLVGKYLKDLETDENDIFVPDYQRDFVWDEIRQSKLIESITLGLPIPIVFMAEDSNGRLEIVDGSQRIRTLAAFLEDDLTLKALDRLTELNELKYSDLPKSRQKKINNTPIRMIVLSEAATEEVRNDLFERINRGSDLLRNMEKRKGIYQGPFNGFIYNNCAKNDLLKKLAPLSKSVKNRQEHEELILRFFLLIDDYPRFKTHSRGIGVVLDEYMDKKNNSFDANEQKIKSAQYERMIKFVNDAFVNGFAKRADQGVSRIFVEALSAGVHFALEENPNISRDKIDPGVWLKDKDFKLLISGKHRTHTPEKIRQRIDYVKDKLINR
ncbi:Protein of unknown function DUF262 [Oceanospirillum multiglobuliferum]|uniref:GmrSD restriction endonucleases N-terminal domain-containing protein n=1 Tax=Oceanospirillum multiglobuliferum TaxID=64969 RepID=A0A1T4S5Q5_9GAMM|nr:DUF262 domain-containing protein [Oceanospirillum multiglobuliferum]OPX54470.1 hypothetical protein BTE48_14235 [Oceanospirillum multiglobuliferum]SKA23575.1 Protein of unknown function DUF262 [Oceanospirillum multiglobuliferum]